LTISPWSVCSQNKPRLTRNKVATITSGLEATKHEA